MLIIPAIDLRGGRCVRLIQGRSEDQTVYSDDPLGQARVFAEAGAMRLHLVDLDGAFQGREDNAEKIQEIVDTLKIPVQVGGGIRTLDEVKRMLETGVASVIIGTMAVKHPERFEEALSRYGSKSLLLGLDARERRVTVEGWQEGTELDDIGFAQRWKEKGVERVIFTDIARDGMLRGPNLEALEDFASQTELKITASGGVSTLEDLRNLRRLENLGVDQVIVGKAFYNGNIEPLEALAC